MDGQVKNIYLPAELLASMYNLYGGSGKSDEVLCLHDVQIMTAFLEYFYNAGVDCKSKSHCFFYTLPYFYTGNRNAQKDSRVKTEYRELREQYSSRVRDDESSGCAGALFLAADKLLGLKRSLLPGLFGIKETPGSPYEYAAVLAQENNLFRIGELYKKKRYTGENLFENDRCVDYSTFFELVPGVSKDCLSPGAFSKREADMQKFIELFFDSDSYKAMVDDKTQNFAPDINLFMASFKRAVEVYNKRGFKNLNKKYVPVIERAKSNFVDFEIITE